jgi:hypothetical protein
MQCDSCLNDLHFTISGDQDSCGCSIGEFVSTTVKEEEAKCVACQDVLMNCQTCNIDGSQCLGCRYPFHLSSTGECTKDICIESDESNNCLKCVTGYLTEEGSCVVECSERYSESSPGQCKKAEVETVCEVRDCAQCSSENVCSKCIPGKICNLTCSGDSYIHDYFGTKSCVLECSAPNSVMSSQGCCGIKAPNCRYCEESCSLCVETATVMKCLSCADSTHLTLKDTCVETCPEGMEKSGSECVVSV